MRPKLRGVWTRVGFRWRCPHFGFSALLSTVQHCCDLEASTDHRAPLKVLSTAPRPCHSKECHKSTADPTADPMDSHQTFSAAVQDSVTRDRGLVIVLDLPQHLLDPFGERS